MYKPLTLYVSLQLGHLLSNDAEGRGQIQAESDAKHLIEQSFDVLLHLGTHCTRQHADADEH